MVGLPVLGARAALIVPIEEDNHARYRLSRAVHPLPTLLKPPHTVFTTGKLRAYANVYIAALVGAPADKAGAPFHMVSKAIPRPVQLTAYISDLR